MEEQTRIDIEEASAEAGTCIMLYAVAKSPYEYYIHETNPCVKERLIARGWTEVTAQELKEYKECEERGGML